MKMMKKWMVMIHGMTAISSSVTVSNLNSSWFKEDKDVAHKVLTEMAFYVEQKGGRQFDDATMKSIMNDPANFRMVNSCTNQLEHCKIDHSLIEKSKTGDSFNAKEKKRAIGIAKVNQECFMTQYPPLYDAVAKTFLTACTISSEH